jgi:hypothetical protein
MMKLRAAKAKARPLLAELVEAEERKRKVVSSWLTG